MASDNKLFCNLFINDLYRSGQAGLFTNKTGSDRVLQFKSITDQTRKCLYFFTKYSILATHLYLIYVIL